LTFSKLKTKLPLNVFKFENNSVNHFKGGNL